ncbi:MAG: hypothetical protein KAT17_00990 [Candidatus Aminicenantes bacterium]|nr:hypothetical protein [Candidatus Aminicenantes bacterium]
MEQPTTFTITTFWLDWMLLPIMLILGYLTLRWALVDFKKASKLKEEKVETSPAWIISFPLMICAASWIILGFASLIKEEYWEHRVWCLALVIWCLCSLIGAGLILINVFKRKFNFSTAELLNFVGLILLPIIIGFPAFMEVSTGTRDMILSHIWTVLLIVCVGCLLKGMIKGFPYNFPRLALAIGIVAFIGLGGIEMDSGQSAFPWFSRIWDLQLGQAEFEASLPDPTIGWQIIGAIKLLLGMGLGVLLLIGSKLEKIKRKISKLKN